MGRKWCIYATLLGADKNIKAVFKSIKKIYTFILDSYNLIRN